MSTLPGSKIFYPIPLVHLRNMDRACRGQGQRAVVLVPPADHGPVSPLANEEYYQLLMSSESQPCSCDVPSYTMEQVEGVTSEYIVKNAVSVLTGHKSSLG